MHGDIDFKSLREKTHLTLSGPAELSEYGLADILRLERGEKASRPCGKLSFPFLYKPGKRGLPWTPACEGIGLYKRNAD